MSEGILNKFYQKVDNRERWRKEELAFLPAALEIQETPPSPIGRAIIWTIVSLFFIAIVWSLIGQIDIVAVAQGKIIPSGRVKVIQPLEIGVVKALHVDEGQSVEQGQALITLDATQTQSDSIRLSNELLDARLRAGRLRAFLSTLASENEESGESGIEIDEEDRPGNISRGLFTDKKHFQQRLLREQEQEYLARREALQSELNRQLAARETAQSEAIKAERTLPLIKQRSDALSTLLEDQLVSRESYLEFQQEYIEMEQDLVTQRSRVQEINASINTLQQQLMTQEAETRRAALEDLEQTTLKVVSLEQELKKAELRDSQQVLSAPITGTVQQMAVHTVGGVVTPAQELMLIVPQEDRIEVEAYILNRDIGFVEEGQAAEVKIDAFNFTKYGVIEAEISHISNDAINDEKLGLVYAAKVLLKDTSIQVDRRLVKLSPGMSVAVEIKTGKRRLIEYFLSPLLRFKQESIRER